MSDNVTAKYTYKVMSNMDPKYLDMDMGKHIHDWFITAEEMTNFLLANLEDNAPELFDSYTEYLEEHGSIDMQVNIHPKGSVVVMLTLPNSDRPIELGGFDPVDE